MVRKSLKLFDRALLVPALVDSLRKLSPRVQLRNPVMFVVYVGSILTSLLFLQALRGRGEAPAADSYSPSPYGCGLPCCLPTSPKRWRRGAAKLRQPRCAA